MDTHNQLVITLSVNLSLSSHINSVLASLSPMASVFMKLKYSVDKGVGWGWGWGGGGSFLWIVDLGPIQA